MTSSTGSVVFTAPTTNSRTVGLNSRFAPVTRADVEALLTPLGFTNIKVPGTSELVFAKRVGPYSLRVLTGCNADGTPRPHGSDAIRTQLWAKNDRGVPVRVRGAKRTMRVFSWRRNLLRKITDLTAWAVSNGLPTSGKPSANTTEKRVAQKRAACCPLCGGGLTAPKLNHEGHPFRGCLRFPACRGAVDAR